MQVWLHKGGSLASGNYSGVVAQEKSRGGRVDTDLWQRIGLPRSRKVTKRLLARVGSLYESCDCDAQDESIRKTNTQVKSNKA